MTETEEQEKLEKKGILYLVSTPIGNWDDISLRALKILKNCDKVICEEGKAGARILKQYNVHKEIELLNEQNEEEMSQELIYQISQGQNLALISDCGTPVFADPGINLVKAAISRNIDIVVVPGASSIMTSIVRSGFTISEFLYGGFLSRNKEDRILQLQELSKERRTIVLLETPYRLMPFLEAAKDVMPYRNAYLACNLTLPFETHHYGTFLDLYKKFKEKRFKGEFTIVFEGLPKDKAINAGWQPPKRDYRDSDRDSRPYNRDSRGGSRWDSRGAGGSRNSGGGSRDSRGGGGSRDSRGGGGSRDSRGGSGSRDSRGGSRDSRGGSRDSGGGSRDSRGGSRDSGGGSWDSRGGSRDSRGGSRDSGGGSRDSRGGSRDSRGGSSGSKPFKKRNPK